MSKLAVVLSVALVGSSVACGGAAFESGGNQDSADATDDGATSSDDASTSDELSPVPPPDFDATSTADGSVVADALAGDAESVDANDASTPQDASADSSPTCLGPTHKECSTACVATSDPDYGCSSAACGACSFANASPTCGANGACAISKCTTSFDDCNHDAGDGCETDLSKPAHCGSCSNPCGTSAPYCVPSGNGFACGNDCPAAAPKLCGSTCVDEQTDPNHCGSCTNACASVTHGEATCTGGTTCSFTCDLTYSKCENVGGVTNGCYLFSSDVNHCGGCTTKCAAPANGNGSATCDATNGGTCDVTCNASYSRCGSGPGAYTCNDLTSDDANCKTCGNKCPTVQHGSDHCVASACTVSCDASYHLCGGACFPNTDLPTDDACVIDETYGVFVSNSLGLAAGADGSRAAPYKTLAAGLSAAASAHKRLYVCAEQYAEAVTLRDGVSMFGYFACSGTTWTVGSGRASIQSPSIPAVAATNLTTATRVEGFNVDSPNAVAPGTSSYAVFVVGTSSLTLVNDLIVAGTGAPGTKAGLGPVPTATNCGAATDGFSASTKGASGTSGGTPTYSASGYAPMKGGDGQPGNMGDTGTAGGPQQCQSISNGCTFNSADNACSSETFHTVCSTAGSPGCGGPGGAAGLGGTGGGSSIALYAWASTVGATSVTLTASSAGKGGDGNTGQAAPTAAVGWTGRLGVAGVDATVNEYSCGTKPNCKVLDGPVTVSGGAAGGPGGQGSAGGAGAGGSSGDSYSYYSGGGATVTLVSSQTSFATALSGGLGTSAVDGAAGHAAAHN